MASGKNIPAIRLYSLYITLTWFLSEQSDAWVLHFNSSDLAQQFRLI